MWNPLYHVDGAKVPGEVPLRLQECPASFITPEIRALLHVAFDAKAAHQSGWPVKDPDSEIPEVVLYDTLIMLKIAGDEAEEAINKAIRAK